MLPRLASGEVIREIRRKGGATAPPILLMVSGYKGNNPKADAQRVGAFDILVKPFYDEDFRAAVRGRDRIDATSAPRRCGSRRSEAAASGRELTASDIFSDVLKDVASRMRLRVPRRRPPPPAAPPAPAPAARSAPAPPEADVDQRLRDSLSGMLDSRPTVKTTPAAAPPAEKPAPAAKKFSGDADIDRMISDTLSGLQSAASPAATRFGGPRLPRAAVAAGAPAAPAGATAAPRPAAVPASRSRPRAPAPRRRACPEGPPVSASGPDRFGQYEILERIASGGMAELYRARRSGVEGFQKIVAIKKILPHLADNEGFIAMFADEAKLAAQLNHPNIVHIYDLGKIEAGGYFIAMEHVEGRDLRAILESARELGMPLPVPLAVYVASKVASALDYAHRRRDGDGRDLHIVHRDVSPQNILISYEGDIKLCDFGIAKAASKVSQTESGALKGKIQYMSPEQAWGKPIDRRSDLFSLGTVLYELLTEQKLFPGESDMTVLEKVRAAVAGGPFRGQSGRSEDARHARSQGARPGGRRPLRERLRHAARSRVGPLLLHARARQRRPGDLPPPAAGGRGRGGRGQGARGGPRRSRSGDRAEAAPGQGSARGPPHRIGHAGSRSGGEAARGRSARRADAVPTAPIAPKQGTAPGVFGSYGSRPDEAEEKSRTGLYATIAVGRPGPRRGNLLDDRRASRRRRRLPRRRPRPRR